MQNESDHIILGIDAMEPMELLRANSTNGVAIEACWVSRDPSGSTYLKLHGTRASVRAFVSLNWGDQEPEQYPELALPPLTAPLADTEYRNVADILDTFADIDEGAAYLTTDVRSLAARIRKEH